MLNWLNMIAVNIISVLPAQALIGFDAIYLFCDIASFNSAQSLLIFCSGFKDGSFTQARDAHHDPVQRGVCSEGGESQLCVFASLYFFKKNCNCGAAGVVQQGRVCV